jgi:phospholipid/cholesterol/gamma-HCH transport system substrate-binding protein
MNARSALLSTLRRRMLGVAFLVVVALFVSLTVAFYRKSFESTVDVVLRTGSVGNQLTPQSDVKIRGVVVGAVRDVRATGDGAELSLALEPGKIGALPANVSAQFLPTTLFGPRYVSLELPEQPVAARLVSGDTIEQDHSAASVELDRVLSNTLPVLQAVRPAELASTLNALDQALSGRGKSLGETLSQLNTYVQGLNPSIPNLQRDLSELVGVANTYQQAAPDVLEALKNFSTTARTLVAQQQNLSALTTQLTTTSQDATTFLNKNQQNIIQLDRFSRPTLDLLAEYSPEYPCFLQQMAQYVPRVRQAFGAGTNQPGLHITLEVANNRGKYVPNKDNPAYDDTRGPRCYPIPPAGTNEPQYPPDGPFQDGSSHPPAAKPILPGGAPAQTTSQSATSEGVNTPGEQNFIAALVAPAMGVPPDQVPQWSALLVGPLLRGGEVSYR